MADDEVTPIDSEEPEETPGYKAPAQKTIEELQQLDKDDESLEKYKQTLLGGVDPAAAPADDPRRVVVQQMAFVVEGRPDVVLDLTDVAKLNTQSMVVKEGTEYKIKVTFKVQHEIVSGLNYHHVVSRKGMNVAKQKYMVGSYGPKVEPHKYLSPTDETPKGMIARGQYKIKSQFLDDDKNVHLAWEWKMEVKKDWA